MQHDHERPKATLGPSDHERLSIHTRVIGSLMTRIMKMTNLDLANRIADGLMTQAMKDYPMVEKLVPVTKRNEIRKKVFDLVFKELEIASVK